jgi:hypothetical protein
MKTYVKYTMMFHLYIVESFKNYAGFVILCSKGGVNNAL